MVFLRSKIKNKEEIARLTEELFDVMKENKRHLVFSNYYEYKNYRARTPMSHGNL